MNKHIPLKITLHLEENSRAMLSNCPTDGILAKLYFDKQKALNEFDGNYEQVLPFLKKSDGIYHSSCPIYKINALSNEFITKRLDVDLLKELGEEKLSKAVFDSSSGRYKNWFENFEVQCIDEVYFYVNGNYDVLCDLLSNLRYIGKKSSLGFGKVIKIVVEETKEDYSLVKNNEATRYLPNIEKYKNLNSIVKRKMYMTHPYWNCGNGRDKEICIVPQRRYI